MEVKKDCVETSPFYILLKCILTHELLNTREMECCGQLWVRHMVCGQTCDRLYHFTFFLIVLGYPLDSIRSSQPQSLDYTQKLTISTLAVKLSVSAMFTPRWTATWNKLFKTFSSITGKDMMCTVLLSCYLFIDFLKGNTILHDLKSFKKKYASDRKIT